MNKTECKIEVFGGPFSCIVADPPWPYSAERPFGAPGGPLRCPSAKLRYNLMSIKEISELKFQASENSHLYLWTTNAFMHEAFHIAAAWKFNPKTIITWVKIKDSTSITIPSMRMGFYFRGATEHCLFCVKGKQRLKVRNLPTAFLWKREQQHSKKPDDFYKMVMAASPGPYLELFGRKQRAGWTVYGNDPKLKRGLEQNRGIGLKQKLFTTILDDSEMA